SERSVLQPSDCWPEKGGHRDRPQGSGRSGSERKDRLRRYRRESQSLSGLTSPACRTRPERSVNDRGRALRLFPYFVLKGALAKTPAGTACRGGFCKILGRM